MVTKGRPPSPERRNLDPAFKRWLWLRHHISIDNIHINYLDPDFQRKFWLNQDGSPYRRQRRGRTPGFLTLGNGKKSSMVHVIGMAEYFFYEAKERGKRITKKAAFEKGIQEILTENDLRLSRAKQLAETAMRIHRDMVRDLGLLPIK